jgi:uncharacterized damage-inducible protein DinB
MRVAKSGFLCLALFVLGYLSVSAQSPNRPTALSVRAYFASVNHKVLEMAKDFPADKYEYKLKPEMRTFAELIVHIASGNVYAAKAAHGENVRWDELDPKDYKTKAEVVALMEKSIADSEAALKSLPDESLLKTGEPWMGVFEHSAEHYGLLVAYYRANGLIPPESRPKK